MAEIPEDSGANTAVARQFCPPEDLPMAHTLQIHVETLRRAVSICDHRLPSVHVASRVRPRCCLPSCHGRTRMIACAHDDRRRGRPPVSILLADDAVLRVLCTVIRGIVCCSQVCPVCRTIDTGHRRRLEWWQGRSDGLSRQAEGGVGPQLAPNVKSSV